MSAYVFDSINMSDDRDYDFSYGAAPQPTASSMLVPLELELPPPSQQQQQAYFAGGASHAAAFQQQTPHPQFVCNVSDDDTVERDIDLEIEARIRSLTLLSDEENVLSMSFAPSSAAGAGATTAVPTTPELPRTMSQRMLSSVQKNKLRQTQRTERAANRAVWNEGHSSPPSAAPAPMRSENSFYHADDQAHDALFRGDDLRTPQLSRKSSTSATDRLEARISKSFLNRQDSIASAADASDFSSLYSGRRTYPAESVKKNDQRLSEGTPLPAQPETSMTFALEKERVALALAGIDRYGPTARTTEPTVEKVRQEKKLSDSGVSFHFYGGSPTQTPAPARTSRLALTAAGAPAPQYAQQPMSHAMVVPARGSAMLDPKYVVLANQLGDIEKLIDGIEGCLSASTFPSLAPVVLGELDLLKGSTKQIRASGTTLILAEVGRPPTETVNALRRLVSRAAAVQKRIEAIMTTIQSMV